MSAVVVIFGIFGAGYALRWAQDRAEQKRRFTRAVERFGDLTSTAHGWRTDSPKWADEADTWLIDLTGDEPTIDLRDLRDNNSEGKNR